MKHRSRSFIPAALVAAVIMAGSALGPLGGARAASARHAASGPVFGGALRVAYTSNMATMDPAQAYTDDWWLINGAIFNGLYQYDRNGIPRLGLAAAQPTISTDGKTWTFKIRADARFSNGTPVTAADLKYGMMRTMNPHLKPATSWGQPFDAGIAGAPDYIAGKTKDISGIQVLDSHTIRFVLSSPIPNLPFVLAISPNAAIPEAVYSKYTPDQATIHPIGAGPYMLQTWQRGNQAVLVRNPYYFRKDRAYVDKIIAYENETPSLITLRIQKGEVDGFGNDQEVAASDLLNLRNDPKYSNYIVTAASAAVTWLDLDVRAHPLENVKIREAIAMAIDRTRLVQLLGGNAIPAYQMYLPLDTQHDPALDAQGSLYPYNPQKAAALVASSGYDHKQIAILYGSDQSYFAAMAPGIQQQLQQIGLNVNLRSVSYISLLALTAPLTGHQIDEQLWSMDYPDAYDVYYGAMGCIANGAGTYSGAKYCDPAADALIPQAQNYPLGPRRDALFRQAQARVLKGAAQIPLVFLKSTEIVSPKVHGFYYQPAFGWQFENYWVK